jgi:hypothetical protein
MGSFRIGSLAWKRARPFAPLLTAVGLSLVLAACGGDSGKPSASSSSDPNARLLQYTQCLRQHGIQVSDPVNGHINMPTNIDQVTLSKAQDACRSSLPPLSQNSVNTNRTQFDKLLQHAACMRSHGVNVPDPQLAPNGGLINPTPAVDTKSPQFQAAQAACRDLQPTRPSPQPS